MATQTCVATTLWVVSGFDIVGALRRIRRRADMSQRELARSCGVAHSVVARAEAGRRDVSVGFLARAADVAGLRVALLDERGCEIPGMTDAGARDRGYRRLAAHLDTVHSEQRPGRYQHRPSRPQPTYTVDRDRGYRDWLRAREGTPEDHHVEHPGDSPAARSAARHEAVRRRQDEARRRWLESGAARLADPGWVCTCPPLCDELDDRSGKPVHADDCPCGCDVA
jgi:transcriptional regulator with XRE-family HTH domain